MQQHVRIVAVLHIVLGGLGLMAALAVMLIFGGLASFTRFADDPDAFLAGGVLGLIGAAVAVVVVLISLPGLIAGIGLLSYQNWARILMIVISALELPGFPLHTALGIYALWVLLSNEGAALFNRQPVRA